MAAPRDVSIRIAIVEAEQAVNRLRAIGTEGDAAFARIARSAGLVPRQTKAAEEAVGRFAGASGQKFAQLGFQVGDFSTQVAGGTSAMVAFAQQAPQLLGAFGPLGAVIGGIGGAALVAGTAIFGFGREATDAKAASEALEAATRSLDGTIAGSASSVEDLARKYSVLSAEMRELERLSLEKKVRDANSAIEGQMAALDASVRSLTNPEQLAFLRGRATLGQQLNPQYQPPAGATERLVFLESLAQAAAQANGDIVGLAVQVDRLVKSSDTAEKSFRDFAEGLIEPAENILKAREDIKKLEAGLDSLAGRKREGVDPFLDQAKAAEQAEKATDKANKASARATEQADRRANALAIEIQNMQRLVAAGDQSADAYERERLAVEAETRARAAGLDPKGREAQLLQELTTRFDEQSEARKRNADAERDRLKAIQDTYLYELGQIGDLLDGKPAGNDNRQARDPWAEAETRLQNATADAIRDGMEEGFKAESIISSFADVLKTTVAESITASLYDSLLGDSGLKGALGTKLADKGITAFGGDATFGQAGAAALGAGFSGYAIGQTAGSRPVGLIGGAVSGAAAGSVLGPYGAIAGGIIGGVAGFIGGGAGGGERNNNYQGGYDTLTGRPVTFQNTRPDPGNTSNVGSVVTQLDMLRDGLRGLNIAVGQTELTIQSGNRSGLTLNGESFSSLGGLTEAALDKLLAAASLTEEQRRVAAASNATDAQGLLSDLGFIDEFKQLAGTMSALDAQAKALEVQFGTARDRAQELGFSQAELTALNRAESRAQRELQQQAGRDRGNILDASGVMLGDHAAALRTALRNQAAQFDQMRQQLEALGGTAEQLAELDRDEAEARAALIRVTREQAQAEREAAKARREAEAEARRQARLSALGSRRDDILGQMRDQADRVRGFLDDRLGEIAGRRSDIASAFDPLTSLREQLLTGDLGGRDAQMRLAAVRGLYEDAVGAARLGGTTGEESANVARLAQQYIEQQRAATGSSVATGDVTRQVVATLNELTGGLNREDRQLALQEKSYELQRKQFEQDLPKEIRAAAELNARGLAKVMEKIDRLEAQLARLNELEALVRRRTG